MQLIQVKSNTINHEVKQTVNARELHEFLGSKRKFSDWMKERIELYDFTEGQDYVIHKIVTQYNQVDRIDYAVTLDMAKEICMVERNDKGKQARQYFIECERQSKQLPMNPASMSRMQLLQLAMQAEEERIALEHKVDELKPRAAVADRLDVAEGRLTIRDAAKALKMQQTKFVNWLLLNNWMYRDGKGKLRGYANKTPKYIEHKITPIPTDEDADKVSMQAMITPAGLTRLADIFNVEAELDFDQAA